ncbi:MAG: NAD(P)/FAD-dependent oxidoreductase [Microthrixaceae bacterium]|nr:NAD(P)/FAD-dependent oxidoreductase [Microthrixaceae bacterium]
MSAKATTGAAKSAAPKASVDKSQSAEEFDVLIIGAGLSGVGAAHHLQTSCPWATYAVLESRDSMGGTWDLFRYPGIRSDSDMFTLSYEFKPWKGEKSISDGESILNYIKETAAEAGIDEHIRYGHKVVGTNWSSEDSRWHVTAERNDGSKLDLTAKFIISCTGYYRYDKGYVPDFKGMDSFEGTIAHPQHWPEDLDYEDKLVIIIGSGATAITLVPAMAPLADHVTMLQRSPTYLLSLPAKNPIADLARKALPGAISGPLVRWSLAMGTLGIYNISRAAPGLVRSRLLSRVKRALPKGYDVDRHFTPKYAPWDQRLCVVTDGDLFREIKKGTVDVRTDNIVEFTPKGILLESGDELQADIIVPATGLDVLFLGGINLCVDGEQVDPGERLSYKGTMLEGVPNLAIMFGYANASWTLKADLSANYVCRLLNHMHVNDLDFCIPEQGEDAGEHLPLLGLSSGYIQRSVDRLPKQGEKFPWQVHQSYIKDYRSIKMSRIDDDAMRFGKIEAPAKETGTSRKTKAKANA